MGSFNSFNKCDKCGSVNPASSRYCYQCNNDLSGATAPVICAKCGTANSTVANFCKRCGTKLAKVQSTKRCPLCSAVNPVQAASCMNCRYNFVAPEEEPQTFFVQPVKTVTQPMDSQQAYASSVKPQSDFARAESEPVPVASVTDVEQLVRQEIEKLREKQYKEDEIKKLNEEKQKAEAELENLRRARRMENDDPATARAAAAAKAEIEAARAEAERARKEADRIKMEAERQALEREAARIKEDAIREANKIKEEAEKAKADAAKEKEAAAAKAKAAPRPQQPGQRPRDPRMGGGDPRARDPRMAGPRPQPAGPGAMPPGAGPQARPVPMAPVKPPEPKKRPLAYILGLLVILLAAYVVLLPQSLDFGSLGIFAMEASSDVAAVNATGWDLVIYSLSTVGLTTSAISQGCTLFEMAGWFILAGTAALLIYFIVCIIHLVSPSKKGGVAWIAISLAGIMLILAVVISLYDAIGMEKMKGEFATVNPGWNLWLIPISLGIIALLNSTKKLKAEPVRPGMPGPGGPVHGGPMPPPGGPRPGGPMPPQGGPRPGGPMPPQGGPRPGGPMPPPPRR